MNTVAGAGPTDGGLRRRGSKLDDVVLTVGETLPPQGTHMYSNSTVVKHTRFTVH